jgi:SAM-dependent methyltransferase
VVHPLPLTGERTLPGVRGEEYWFARHEAAYRWLADTCADRLTGAVVVEAGSGEGYGAALLRAAGARVVVALEYDEAAVRHARSAYPEVLTTRANLAAMPLAAGSADVVVSLQVVEHLWDLRGFLRDCASVLRPGGLLVVSTPNRPVFSPGLGRGEKPTNPFHVEELDAGQLRDLLGDAGFVDVDVLGLHHGERIEAWERSAGTGLVAAQVAAVLSPTTPAETDRSAASSGGKQPFDQSHEGGVPGFVASVTVDDFEIGDAVGSQDLIALAVRP